MYVLKVLVNEQTVWYCLLRTWKNPLRIIRKRKARLRNRGLMSTKRKIFSVRHNALPIFLISGYQGFFIQG